MDLSNRNILNKVGCVFPIVVASTLPHVEFGPNYDREDASHFIKIYTQDSDTLSLKNPVISLITIFGSVLLFLITIKELYVIKSDGELRENNKPAGKSAHTSTSSTVVRLRTFKNFSLVFM